MIVELIISILGLFLLALMVKVKIKEDMDSLIVIDKLLSIHALICMEDNSRMSRILIEVGSKVTIAIGKISMLLMGSWN